jgi:hypothetical protein
MIYVANPSTAKVRAAMSSGQIACMTTPRQGNRVPDGAWWAADNGVYGRGFPGDTAWWEWLASRSWPSELCLFATAPDVVGNAAATLRRSAKWLPMIRSLGYPAALVAQNGLENLEVPWGEFDVLFIGGSTEWKLGPYARALVAEAKRRGKQVHMGRVNSSRRFAYAGLIGCDTVDGTYIAFGPDVNLGNVLTWQSQLPLIVESA